MKRTHLTKIFILAALFLAVWPCASWAEDVLQKEILGRKAGDWLKDLVNKDDARMRRNAAFAFGRGGGAFAGVVDELLKLAENDDDASVREAAAYAVGEIGATTSAEAIRVLKSVMIKDKDEKVRRSAAYALGCYGRHAAAAKNDLERALNDSKGSVRQNAAWCSASWRRRRRGTLCRLCADCFPKTTRRTTWCAETLPPRSATLAGARASLPRMSLMP